MILEYDNVALKEENALRSVMNELSGKVIVVY